MVTALLIITILALAYFGVSLHQHYARLPQGRAAASTPGARRSTSARAALPKGGKLIRLWLVLRQGPRPADETWYVNQVLDSLHLDGRTVRSQMQPGGMGSISSVDSLDDVLATMLLMRYADEKGARVDTDRDEIGRLSFRDGHGHEGWFVYARRAA